MWWYEMTDEQRADIEARGIDIDLIYCLEYNRQEFGIADIDEVLAVWEGENDEDDWRWILKMKKGKGKPEGRYAFVQGGCDYTGWDCQSWATSAFAKTAKRAALYALGDVPLTDGGPDQAGLGHLIKLLFEKYGENFSEVYDNLLAQLKNGKFNTWRQEMESKMNVPYVKPQDFIASMK